MKTYILLLVSSFIAVCGILSGIMISIINAPVDPPPARDKINAIDYRDSLMLRYDRVPFRRPNEQEQEKIKHLNEHAYFQL